MVAVKVSADPHSRLSWEWVSLGPLARSLAGLVPRAGDRQVDGRALSAPHFILAPCLKALVTSKFVDGFYHPPASVPGRSLPSGSLYRGRGKQIIDNQVNQNVILPVEGEWGVTRGFGTSEQRSF